MDQPSEELRAFAEDPAVFMPTEPDEERILTDRYCLTFTPGEHYWSTSVARIRFGPEDVEAGVAEVRALMLARGRKASAWKVGPSSTPAGLLDRLVALGMEVESEEGSAILILSEPPRVPPSAFGVRFISTFEDHRATIEVAIEAFGFPDQDAADERRRARETFDVERAGGLNARMLVMDGDRPVATGAAWFSPYGLYLGGGATVPSDRRRGAMTAMIGAAWEEAERRGTPTLVTWGGAMAAPTLERIGFRRIGRIDHLIDRP